MLQEWFEGTSEPQIVSILFFLPTSFVNNKGKVAYQVNRVCNGLTISVTWPEEILNTKDVHKWVPNENNVLYHPEQLMFKGALAMFKVYQSEIIHITKTISLWFKVLNKVHMKNTLGLEISPLLLFTLILMLIKDQII